MYQPWVATALVYYSAEASSKMLRPLRLVNCDKCGLNNLKKFRIFDAYQSKAMVSLVDSPFQHVHPE